MAANAAEASDSARKPSDWLFRYIVNPVMKAILRSPLHGMVSGVLMILTYTGHKSGKRYSTPISYHREDEKTLYTFSRSQWPKNFLTPQTVTLRLQGQTVQATAETIQDEDRLRPIVDKWIDHYGIEGSRRRGILRGVGDNPSEEDIARSLRGSVVVRFRLS